MACSTSFLKTMVEGEGVNLGGLKECLFAINISSRKFNNLQLRYAP